MGKHYNFKQKAMELIEAQGGDYLHIRNVLQSEDYLGRTLEDGEKKQLRRYLERRDAAVESEKACASASSTIPIDPANITRLRNDATYSTDLPMAQAVSQPMACAVVPKPNPTVVSSFDAPVVGELVKVRAENEALMELKAENEALKAKMQQQQAQSNMRGESTDPYYHKRGRVRRAGILDSISKRTERKEEKTGIVGSIVELIAHKKKK